MPSLDKRVAKLEDAFLQHLAESGEIRSDLKWLRKAFWTLAGMGSALAVALLTELGKHIWG